MGACYGKNSLPSNLNKGLGPIPRTPPPELVTDKLAMPPALAAALARLMTGEVASLKSPTSEQQKQQRATPAALRPGDKRYCTPLRLLPPRLSYACFVADCESAAPDTQ